MCAFKWHTPNESAATPIDMHSAGARPLGLPCYVPSLRSEEGEITNISPLLSARNTGATDSQANAGNSPYVHPPVRHCKPCVQQSSHYFFAKSSKKMRDSAAVKNDQFAFTAAGAVRANSPFFAPTEGDTGIWSDRKPGGIGKDAPWGLYQPYHPN